MVAEFAVRLAAVHARARFWLWPSMANESACSIRQLEWRARHVLLHCGLQSPSCPFGRRHRCPRDSGDPQRMMNNCRWLCASVNDSEPVDSISSVAAAHRRSNSSGFIGLSERGRMTVAYASPDVLRLAFAGAFGRWSSATFAVCQSGNGTSAACSHQRTRHPGKLFVSSGSVHATALPARMSVHPSAATSQLTSGAYPRSRSHEITYTRSPGSTGGRSSVFT